MGATLMPIPLPPPGFELDNMPPPPSGFSIDDSSKPKMGGKPPLGFVMDQIQKMAPWNKASQGLRDMAGAGAEKLGGMGVSPKVAAGMMLPVSMAPELLAAGTTINSMLTSPQAGWQAIRKTPQMIGQEMGQAEQAANVGKELPVRRGAFPKLPEGIHGKPPLNFWEIAPYKPQSYPKDPSSFINFVNKRIGNIDQLSPSELSDYNKIFAEMFRNGEVASGTPQFAEATKASKAVNELFNQIPGRGPLSKAYGLSKTMRPVTNPKFWKKAGPMIGYGSLGALATELIKKLVSG